jgi:hypothetical protein
MWPRNRQSKEGLQTSASPESNAPLPPTYPRYLGPLAISGFAAAELDQGTAEVRAFDLLRTNTHELMRSEYAQRIATNPTPTARELSFGMYAENLEPQVREATFTMREKGYGTSASGFFHGDITWRTIGIEGEDVPRGTYGSTVDPINKRAQTMDFSQGLELSEATIEDLTSVGAEVVRYPDDNLIHRIGFVPETVDINMITAQWNAVASVLPDTGMPVPAAEVFNANFADWGATAP